MEALRQGDRICLSVSDDGVGMTGEELERVRKGLYKVEDQNDGGFGIANVFERIRLNYGDSYGLRVDSAVGKRNEGVHRDSGSGNPPFRSDLGKGRSTEKV